MKFFWTNRYVLYLLENYKNENLMSVNFRNGSRSYAIKARLIVALPDPGFLAIIKVD
jgi:hypothetical protein